VQGNNKMALLDDPFASNELRPAQAYSTAMKDPPKMSLYLVYFVSFSMR
jgi:hypothetical protein